MRIIKNQSILQRQSDNYIKNELSNVATVVQAPQMLCTYYSIDPDASVTLNGLKNIEDYIGTESSVVYNKVEKLPISGIDTLVTQSQYDDEVGFDEDLSADAIIFPNTVIPKPNDFFIVSDSKVPALYVVTTLSPVTVRSNPFVGIQFRLFSRDPSVIAQLDRQVKGNYLTTVSAIGADKTLLITKESFFDVEHHVTQYIELADLYKTLFYDRTRSAFIFGEIFDPVSELAISFLDISIWRLLFDEGLIVYDDIITYANSNYNRHIEPVYISCPDIILDDHLFKRSVLWRLYTQDTKHQLDEFKYPQSYDPDPRIAKFKGKNLIYLEHYGDQDDHGLFQLAAPVWDDDFVTRIKGNNPYPDDSTTVTGVINQLTNEPIPMNPSLRNAIIRYYNREEIDWDALQIDDSKTTENYILIPIVLAAYKQYIKTLQK